jgi:CRISPR-associated endonuclease/helicase Cas3
MTTHGQQSGGELALAHVTEDGRRHLLVDHLRAVSALAGRFGEDIGCASEAALAGLWHDLGKYSGDFQRMIREENGIDAHIEIEAEGLRRDHSTAGAAHAIRTDPRLFSVAAAIAGHHVGLADHVELRERLRERERHYQAVLQRSPDPEILRFRTPEPPSWLSSAAPGCPAARLRLELHTRMLFSALCDADFLDTEAFFDPTRAAARGRRSTIEELQNRLEAHLGGLEAKAAPTLVNQARAEVRAACISAAAGQPGIYSLTVPTGGGKTLASMSFALHHARLHRLTRVIVAIPFTSIIEQTADVLRAVLSAEAVIEHHSALDPINEHARNRIASENWDAPVIVTTNVQLFESLLANRPSACRKLHNLARSVIVLDEAQALPGRLLPAILDVLRALVTHYGCSVVISTATQPAWRQSPRVPFGFDDVREICPPAMDLFRRLERVDIRWPEPQTRTSYDDLAAAIAVSPSCLAVVHLRQDARRLCEKVRTLVGREGALHLSALMTPEHRSRLIAAVRKAQREGSALRLVSTQLVEAGVDIDFPIVFRALAGLDAIAQAAGRCNREGRLQRGQVVVFDAETDPPPGVPRTGRDLARLLLARSVKPTLADHEALQCYFEDLYERTDLSRGHSIQQSRADLNFETVARSCRLIEDEWSAPLVIADGDAASIIARLQQDGPSRWALRALQRHTINVPRRSLAAWVAGGMVNVVADTVHVLEGPALAAYDPDYGLVPERMGFLDPSSLIVG